MNTMLCGYRDDRRLWDEPEEVEEDPLTEAEKRIEWICDAWADALLIDTYEEWHDVQIMAYGATQMCTYASGMHKEREMLREIGRLAFANSRDCIQAGRYEGATK